MITAADVQLPQTQCTYPRCVVPAAKPASAGPRPVTFVTRVSGTTFSEPAPSAILQLLYFVRAEDANGNLSAPSNIVGGPSLAAQ